MNKEQLALASLRVFLLLLFGVLVLFQVMSLPGQFAYMAQQDPEHAYLRCPPTTWGAARSTMSQLVIRSWRRR